MALIVGQKCVSRNTVVASCRSLPAREINFDGHGQQEKNQFR
jgi:hypothetical protein